MTAKEQYQRNAEDIQALVTRLQAKLEDHAQEAASHPGDWGYAGSLGYVREGLEGLVAFLTGDER